MGFRSAAGRRIRRRDRAAPVCRVDLRRDGRLPGDLGLLEIRAGCCTGRRWRAAARSGHRAPRLRTDAAGPVQTMTRHIRRRHQRDPGLAAVPRDIRARLSGLTDDLSLFSGGSTTYSHTLRRYLPSPLRRSQLSGTAAENRPTPLRPNNAVLTAMAHAPSRRQVIWESAIYDENLYQGRVKPTGASSPGGAALVPNTETRIGNPVA